MKPEKTIHHADIVVVGGGLGGCAAALAAVKTGLTVILTEETEWLGGQLTSQLVPADEHGWIEHFGRTASYAGFRKRIREYYRANYPLNGRALNDPLLNPGNAWVSPIACEPRVALAVLQGMLAPHAEKKSLLVLNRHVPVAARKTGADMIGEVIVEDKKSGAQKILKGRYIIDATELGEILELAEVEHVTGQESRAQTGEPSAPPEARPMNMQAFTWCFAVGHSQGANHVGPPPENYDFWKNYVFPITPPWPGPLLSFTALDPRNLNTVCYGFKPNPPPAGTHVSGRRIIERDLWTYRRIVDRHQFLPGACASDVTVINWPMNDYLGKVLIGAGPGDRAAALHESRQLSLSLLHWLQTEAPRADGGKGWPGLHLRPDITGTPDGLAIAPYIRESRRIRAKHTVREQDIAAALLPAGATLAREFEDSVGVGSYRIDLHPSSGGDNFIDVATKPFQIPLGALIPVRVKNLLPGAKNIGTTHITNGCYRLHPVEWNIGEASGLLAAFCLRHTLFPDTVFHDAGWRARHRDFLHERGVETAWPASLDPAGGDPHAHAIPPS